MTTLIETVAAGHAAVLAAIHGRSFVGETWNETAMASLLAMPGACALLAREGDAPVGFLLARIAGGEGEIISIAVLPEHRGRGIGAQLARHLVDRATGWAEALFLEVADDNAPAQALYRRLGFMEVGRRHRYYADGRDALLMRLKL